MVCVSKFFWLYSYYFVLPLALVPATLWQHAFLGKLSLSLTPLNDGVISSVNTAFTHRSLHTLLVRLLKAQPHTLIPIENLTLTLAMTTESQLS